MNSILSAAVSCNTRKLVTGEQANSCERFFLFDIKGNNKGHPCAEAKICLIDQY